MVSTASLKRIDNELGDAINHADSIDNRALDTTVTIATTPPIVLLTTIMQLCKEADSLTIQYPTWYRNTRIKFRSLTSLLRGQSDNENHETRRQLSYILERQLFYNLGYEQTYDVMIDTRCQIEEKLLEGLHGKHIKPLAELMEHILDGDKAYEW